MLLTLLTWLLTQWFEQCFVLLCLFLLLLALGCSLGWLFGVLVLMLDVLGVEVLTVLALEVFLGVELALLK